MKRFVPIAALALSLSACADFSATVSKDAAAVTPALETACNDALMVANIAGLVPGVGAIVPYITAGCATAEGIAKLAADPTSAQWVGALIGEVKSLASVVGVKV